METIKEFGTILLKDGRTGAVVEVYGVQEVFDVDIGSSPADWETITVNREEIVRAIR